MHQVLGQICQPETGQGHLAYHRDGVDYQLTLRPHVQLATTFFEWPGPETARGRQTERDAGMGGQVMWGVRPSSPVEVGRRSDNRLTEIRPDAYGDHVLRHLLAKAYARVVAFSHDVG